MANLPLAFAELLGGGIMLTAGVTGSTVADTIRGQVTRHPLDGASSGSAAASAAGSTSAGTAAPGAKGIMSYLQGQGFSKVAAAGLVGNLQQESNLSPTAPGGGIAQWIGSRWSALTSYAAGQNLSPNSLQAQLGFLVSEIKTQYGGTLAQANAASSPGEAATIFSTQYERPGTPMLQNRINYANAAYAA